jgi:hypothetical protein
LASALVATSVLVFPGCGPARPARVPQPAFSPADVSKCIVERADRDNDGECTVEELAVVPGLRLEEAIADIDSDKNGRLSGKEIHDWLAAMRATKVALAPAAVCVVRRGAPVPGLRVRIVPDPCMGNTSEVAEGISDDAGIAMLRIASPPLGAHFGIYRVEITGTDTSGNPVPAKYNSASSLGLVVPLVGRAPRLVID